ncbi:hypothetical protein [Salirhabdus salicampi]|nr:hypothetical protein [Salirhabdus salicampi]MCP8617537.1 hypothetical protein [Salirhabdus salicampi]
MTTDQIELLLKKLKEKGDQGTDYDTLYQLLEDELSNIYKGEPALKP